MTCQICTHERICEVYRSVVLASDKFKTAAKNPDAYALFMSSLRQALAENCRYYRPIVGSWTTEPEKYGTLMVIKEEKHE